MPACDARSASSAPTCFALAVLSPLVPRIDASRVDADTSVPPAVSSTSCANTCRAERVTTSRGRAALPVTFFLTRRWRRARAETRAAVRRARRHVGDRRAGEPVPRPDLAVVVRPGPRDGAVRLRALDGGGPFHAQDAARSSHGALAAADGDVHAAGNDDG